jgi:hypothetical protein
MISFAEFEIALRGLARLARFDKGFAGFFDLSHDGARRSFLLALPILPIYLVLMHLNAAWAKETDMVRVVASELIGYLLMWVAFPLVLLFAARLIESGPRVYGAIAVYNWLSVLSVALQLPVGLAVYFGLGNESAAWLFIAIQGFAIACEFFAFKRLLEIGIEITLALVAIEFILSRIIMELIVVMARAPLF